MNTQFFREIRVRKCSYFVFSAAACVITSIYQAIMVKRQYCHFKKIQEFWYAMKRNSSLEFVLIKTEEKHPVHTIQDFFSLPSHTIRKMKNTLVIFQNMIFYDRLRKKP